MMPTQLRCILAATVTTVAISVGCSEGELVSRPDVGLTLDAQTSVDGRQSDAAGPDGDAARGESEPGAPPVESFVNCGAGGVSTGSEVRAIQCYGPVDLAGGEASGEAVRWQPGAFRVVTD